MSSSVDPSAAVFVGIDVAKDELVVAVRPSGRTWSVPNEPATLTALATELHQHAPVRVVLEATGGYERAAVTALQAVRLPVAVVNPRQVRQFARSTGRLAKTDTIDAGILAHYGEAVHPPVAAPIDAATQELDGWVERRRQVVQQRTAERLRLATAHPSLRPRIQRHIEWLEEDLEAVERTIAELLKQSSTLARTAELLDSVPGIGLKTAAVLVSQVPELGRIDGKALAALIGVAPLNRDSGKLRGKRSCWGGRANVRAALYMPTRTACRWNPVIRALYDRLIDAGKPKLVAIVACMRKLLTICNAMVASGKPWDPAIRTATA
jgi:transposase